MTRKEVNDAINADIDKPLYITQINYTSGQSICVVVTGITTTPSTENGLRYIELQYPCFPIVNAGKLWIRGQKPSLPTPVDRVIFFNPNQIESVHQVKTFPTCRALVDFSTCVSDMIDWLQDRGEFERS